MDALKSESQFVRRKCVEAEEIGEQAVINKTIQGHNFKTDSYCIIPAQNVRYKNVAVDYGLHSIIFIYYKYSNNTIKVHFFNDIL